MTTKTKTKTKTVEDLFHAKVMTLKDVFSMDLSLSIIQRLLVWGEKEISDLHNTAYLHYNNNRALSLGSLVIQDGSIIDGQQRLTNLFVLLKVSQAHMPEAVLPRDKAIFEFVKNLPSINYQAREGLNNFMGAHFGVIPSFDFAMKIQDTNISCIKTITNLCRGFINGGGANGEPINVFNFCDFLINKVGFMVHLPQSTEEASDVFYSVNGTGIHLTPADMLKVHIFQNTPVETHLESAKLWEGLENLLGTKEFPRFLSLLRGYYVRDKAEGTLVTEFCSSTKKRKGVFTKADSKITPANFISEMLRLKNLLDNVISEKQPYASMIKALTLFAGNDESILPILALRDKFGDADFTPSVQAWFAMQVLLARANVQVSLRRKFAFSAVAQVFASSEPPTEWDIPEGIDLTADARILVGIMKQPAKFLKIAQEVKAGANLAHMTKIWFEMVDPAGIASYENTYPATFAMDKGKRGSKKIKSDETWSLTERLVNKLVFECESFPLAKADMDKNMPKEKEG